MIPDHAPQFTLGRQRTGRNPDSARALFAPTRRFLSSPLCRFGHYPFSSASVNLQPQRYEPSKTRSDCGSLGFILFLGRLLRHSSTAITFCKSSMSMKMVSFTTDPPPSPALHWTHHERIWYRSEAGWGQRQRLRLSFVIVFDSWHNALIIPYHSGDIPEYQRHHRERYPSI